MPVLPLEGIRIIDATNSWSGPYMVQLLASLGAEAIKVESIQYLDTWRAGGTQLMEEEYLWERSPLWNSVNTDKLGITLDLNRPRGVEIFKRLVKISDIVAENYTPRVMRNFGLDYPMLRDVNPKIIMISLPAHGSSGPWRDYPGFAASIEQMAGIPQLTGYPDGPPKMSGTGFTDPIAGANGAAAIMMALLFRQMTGKGQYIDLSQIEAVTSLIGEAIIDYSMNRRIQPRRGNRHPSMAPHGCYCCKGDDLWVNIAVSSDEEWRRFGEAIGSPPWAREERFADGLSRWHNQDELDKLVEGWTIQHDHYEVMNTLQKAGIAAGAVLTSAELLDDPHLKERGTYQTIERAIIGTYPYPVASAPMKLSNSPVSIRRPAPLLGEHNEYVLGNLLGMSREEIQELADNQIIGNTPLGI
jgi:crotonobetainyl-CoA:carnitine CoA-transferase CaiB-like acyl-CoA transferase